MNRAVSKRSRDRLLIIILVLLLAGCRSASRAISSTDITRTQDASLVVATPPVIATEQQPEPTATVMVAQAPATDVPTSSPPTATAQAAPQTLPTQTPTVVHPPILTPQADSAVAGNVAPSGKTHVVVNGETLSEVARDFGVRVEDIMVLNEIKSARSVIWGTKLQIPMPLNESGVPIPTPTAIPSDLEVHVLSSGETLSEIAQDYNVSLESLMEVNNIQRASFVISGSRLVIPNQVAQASENLSLAAPTSQSSPLPSPTPSPTSVPTEKAQASNAATAAATAATTAELDLNSASNLYLLIDGNFVRWHAASKTWHRILLGDDESLILDYRLSDDENVILAQRETVSADTTIYDLAILDGNSGVVTVIDTSRQPYADIALTADGSHAIFIKAAQQSVSEIAAIKLAPLTAEIIVGECHWDKSNSDNAPSCLGLFSGANSQSILFSDQRGLWRGTFDGKSPEPLITFEGNSDADRFEPVSWSPNQQYLIVWGHAHNGSGRFVLDVDSAELHRIPENPATASASAVSWMNDGSLAIIEPSDPAENIKPVLTIYSIDPTGAQLFSEKERVSITTIMSYKIGDRAAVESRAFAPHVIGDDSAEFALLSADEREQGIYQINLKTLRATKVSDWPSVPQTFLTTELSWTPDNSGLLAVHQNDADESLVHFVTTKNEPPVRLPFDSDAFYCCYQWGQLR